MRKTGSDEFDYPGCAKAYREFVRAVVAYEAKLATMPVRGRWAATMPKLSHGMEKQRKVLVRSFSLAKNMYFGDGDTPKPAAEAERWDLDAGAEFLETVAAALSSQQEKGLKQMGATVRNASGYLNCTLKVRWTGRRRPGRSWRRCPPRSCPASLHSTAPCICADVLDAKLQPARVSDSA
ncbi:hypothetical protein QYE76_048733 [Lolium multiflorum]|uniref:Uncharacterized protein n=1 Tax=Lolium multiflorum TaxID=4521 RepID=A0AAD8SMX6_LOLMU|nr:hypothetical protein QYE76_048733 [Lolium multiflorum]